MNNESKSLILTVLRKWSNFVRGVIRIVMQFLNQNWANFSMIWLWNGHLANLKLKFLVQKNSKLSFETGKLNIIRPKRKNRKKGPNQKKELLNWLKWRIVTKLDKLFWEHSSKIRQFLSQKVLNNLTIQKFRETKMKSYLENRLFWLQKSWKLPWLKTLLIRISTSKRHDHFCSISWTSKMAGCAWQF